MTAGSKPSHPRPRALLLTPGAGADREHHTLVAIEEALKIHVERVDFPYRREGRRAPDRAPKAVAAVVDEAKALARRKRVGVGKIALGGRSYGGRMCSMAVAEGLPAAGLVLIAYPLHPPGKPENLRTAHFPEIDVPCLFISGDKDPFGTPDELRAAAKRIRGPVTHVWIENGRHDLRGKDPQVIAAIEEWLAGF